MSHLALARQVFGGSTEPVVQEDRRLVAIKHALSLREQGKWDPPHPFTCAKVAQKAAECSGKGITAASLNAYMSGMSADLRAKLEKLGLPPRHAVVKESARSRPLSSDPLKVRSEYLAAISPLPVGKRTVTTVAETLGLSELAVRSYCFQHPAVAGLIEDYKRPE